METLGNLTAYEYLKNNDQLLGLCGAGVKGEKNKLTQSSRNNVYGNPLEMNWSCERRIVLHNTHSFKLGFDGKK